MFSNINSKLTAIEKLVGKDALKRVISADESLLNLPDNLRKTYIALLKRNNSSATDISTLTGRQRSVESTYLNQLQRMGYVSSKRNGKLKIFYAKGEISNENIH